MRELTHDFGQGDIIEASNVPPPTCGPPVLMVSFIYSKLLPVRCIFVQESAQMCAISIGNKVNRINEVNQLQARLVLGWVTVFRQYVTSQLGPLSLSASLVRFTE